MRAMVPTQKMKLISPGCIPHLAGMERYQRRHEPEVRLSEGRAPRPTHSL